MGSDELVNGGANRTTLVQKVRESFSNYNVLEDERAEINAAMSEIRAKWKAWGLSVKGIKAGRTRAALEADQRELFDESYDLAAEALGRPIEIQADFFEGDQFAVNNEEEPPLDGDGEEQDHLPDNELPWPSGSAASPPTEGAQLSETQPGDGSDADLGKGMHFENEQDEGDAAIAALMPETAKAKRDKAAETTH